MTQTIKRWHCYSCDWNDTGYVLQELTLIEYASCFEVVGNLDDYEIWPGHILHNWADCLFEEPEDALQHFIKRTVPDMVAHEEQQISLHKQKIQDHKDAMVRAAREREHRLWVKGGRV